MNCPNCGNDINQGESFCPGCGTNVANFQSQNIQNQNTNKKAIISLVLSGVSLIIFWWLSIVGIVLGIQALNQIKTTNEKGKGLALAGIIIGAIAIILFVIGFAAGFLLNL